jgi:isocitrate dehydrogenase
MTKDLAMLTKQSTWLTTRQFLEKIKGALEQNLAASA